MQQAYNSATLAAGVSQSDERDRLNIAALLCCQYLRMRGLL